MLAINSTENGPGRLCNRFFRNMMAHILAEKNGLAMKYHDYDKMKALGLDLYTNGVAKDYGIPPLIIRDDNFMQYILNEEPLTTNIQIDRESTYCQTRDFALYMRKYFIKNKWFDTVLNRNKYKDRYKQNQDIYVHVRLGDVSVNTPGFHYYDKCLSKIIEHIEGDYNAFISSDSIHHPICQQLIKKYGLKVISINEVDTILFASTCKYLILSNGTFSWLIGFLGVFSQVFYPKIYQPWHGDVFVFPHWSEVEWKKSI
jgi:hypothetical protein